MRAATGDEVASVDVACGAALRSRAWRRRHSVRRVPSDAELLHALAEPGSFEEFYTRHVDVVFSFARRRCTRPVDVADLVSITFLEAARSAHSFNPDRGTARAWLLGIAMPCLADMHKVDVRQRLLLDRVDPSARLSPDEYEAIERQIDAAALGPRLRAALASLTEAERDLFELVAYDGASVAEASRALGVSPVAGRMRLARARRRMQTVLRRAPADLPQHLSQARPEEAR